MNNLHIVNTVNTVLFVLALYVKPDEQVNIAAAIVIVWIVLNEIRLIIED